MEVFKVSRRDGSGYVVVRARCSSCAREVAVKKALDEGTMVWRNPLHSTVELLRNHPERIGKPALLERSS